jgi:hypothetical protein
VSVTQSEPHPGPAPKRCWYGGDDGHRVKLAVTRALILFAVLCAACGAMHPGVVVRSGGYLADAYGFACECGSKSFDVVGRTFTGMRVRCPTCHHEWVVAAP